MALAIAKSRRKSLPRSISTEEVALRHLKTVGRRRYSSVFNRVKQHTIGLTLGAANMVSFREAARSCDLEFMQRFDGKPIACVGVLGKPEKGCFYNMCFDVKQNPDFKILECLELDHPIMVKDIGNKWCEIVNRVAMGDRVWDSGIDHEKLFGLLFRRPEFRCRFKTAVDQPKSCHEESNMGPHELPTDDMLCV